MLETKLSFSYLEAGAAMASGNAYFTCAPLWLCPDPIQKITGLGWVFWLCEAFISHLPAEPGVKGDKAASLCGQLEWISDQRLPSRCHIQCYPFPINQRPGSEPLVQSKGLFKFIFFLAQLLLILDQILTVKLSLLFRKLFTHVTNSPRQLVYLSLL